ncbi:uncharacterized protein [Watersipora subatra]|uniref:uncharacterized protein n=1 Tax=Watersipora subatra TaxID=2589382 RepID=UPI00355C76D7
MEAMLSQVQMGYKRFIVYYSKTLTPLERNYCVTQRELLAVVKAVKHFWPHLYGQELFLRTDHASLQGLCKRREPSKQVTRWLEMLVEFCYILEHRSGTCYGNADGLKRQPCKNGRECARNEQRDGGPLRKELAREKGPLAMRRGSSRTAGNRKQRAGYPTSRVRLSVHTTGWHARNTSGPARPCQMVPNLALSSAGDNGVANTRSGLLLGGKNDKPHPADLQDTLAVPDTPALVVANTLDEWVFCYLGLLEQIHTNQEAQFESQLMAELC